MTTFHNWLSQIIDEPTKPIEPIETHDQLPNHKMGSTAERTAIKFNAIKGGQGVQNPLRWTQDVITPSPFCTLDLYSKPISQHTWTESENYPGKNEKQTCRQLHQRIFS
jgi:hypothetical protein